MIKMQLFAVTAMLVTTFAFGEELYQPFSQFGGLPYQSIAPQFGQFGGYPYQSVAQPFSQVSGLPHQTVVQPVVMAGMESEELPTQSFGQYAGFPYQYIAQPFRQFGGWPYQSAAQSLSQLAAFPYPHIPQTTFPFTSRPLQSQYDTAVCQWYCTPQVNTQPHYIPYLSYQPLYQYFYQPFYQPFYLPFYQPVYQTVKQPVVIEEVMEITEAVVESRVVEIIEPVLVVEPLEPCVPIGWGLEKIMTMLLQALMAPLPAPYQVLQVSRTVEVELTFRITVQLSTGACQQYSLIPDAVAGVLDSSLYRPSWSLGSVVPISCQSVQPFGLPVCEVGAF